MRTYFARLLRSMSHYLLLLKQDSRFKQLLGNGLASSKTAQNETARDALTSVIIPALNEEKAIASVIRYALSDPATGEVIVVDDSSIDGTADIARAAGAIVITSSMLGKGMSMLDGVTIARFEFVTFLDGDLSGLRPNIITDMMQPLRENQADFVKAKFGRGGGRVTELTAKPMLKVFFPELSRFSQPLGGIISGRVSLFKNLTFESGYGVDIGLLIDAFRKGARLAEVDIGSLEHESQTLNDLSSMASEVSRVIHQYSREAGRLHVEQINEMYEVQRQAIASFEYVLTRQKNRTKILLIDLDTTTIQTPFIEALASATGLEAELALIKNDEKLDDLKRCEQITELFKFVHRHQFEKVAMGLVIKPGVIEFVNYMRRKEFMVGVISNSYFVGSEIIRKRIFADFALAHVLEFKNDICTGKLIINDAFRNETDHKDQTLCKSHVLALFRAKTSHPTFEEIWAIGDSPDDIKMLANADRGFVMQPQSEEFESYPNIARTDSFSALIETNS